MAKQINDNRFIKAPLKDSENMGRKLHNHVFIIVLILSLMLCTACVYIERHNQINDAQNTLNISIQRLGDHIQRLKHDENLRPIIPNDIKSTILTMDQIRSEQGSRLYIVDESATLLLKDSLLGPFGSDNGQQFNLIPALKKAIESAIVNGATATYQGEDGKHLISSFPLSPRATVIGDTLLPPWYTAFSATFVASLLIGGASALITRSVTRNASRAWRRQSLAQSIIDPLTSLPNRRGFELLAKQILACPDQRSSGVYLVLANINQLHDANIKYGLEAGDTLIRQVSASLRHHLPSEDILCRWNGDEFLALIRSTQIDAINEFCRRISTAVNNQDFILSGEKVPVSIRVADYQLTQDETLPHAIVKLEQILKKAP
ncbi:GGDEF domain-containing protein [Marinomonas mediterranea]|uniref:GGDEF domain-containing protein n=1 Tax=Marinomonas mediterranea TaxID=119864 RepID=UPI002349685F|nr:GGDEF domain-containing protein [Marinomonas mediterranea]WCN08410.1 diguanylate cyclase [Marinomonas mediterranea]